MKLTTATAFAVLALATSSLAYAQTAPAPVVKDNTAVSDRMDLKGSWRSSKLIGLDVYNQADEKLGDVNELILDRDGKVKLVVVGVGGFLGMGEHDIAVTMDKLKFMEEPHKSAKSDAKATTGSTAAERRDAATDWTPDHAVMNATKDQLKAMKQFKYSDYN